MITVSQDGRGDFRSIQEAVDAMAADACGPADGGTAPRVIRIRPGVYRERVAVYADGVTLEGEDPEQTVITFDASAMQTAPDGTERTTFRSWTVMICGRDVTLRNLTVRNDAGDGREVGQAVAVYAAGDRGRFIGCRFIAHQDTLYCGPLREPDVTEELGARRGSAEAHPLVQNGPLTTSRLYFRQCCIEGDVDFIFGNYRCWFEDCTLFMGERGGWYTAANTHGDQPYGFVFHHCFLTGCCAPGKAFLGRPWRAGAYTVFLACRMDAHVAGQGFADWDEERQVTGRLGEWRTEGPGAAPGMRHPRQKRLTDTEAATITLPAVLGGGDGWNPEF